ncbi:alpha-N-acetylglucosaminidase [Babesia ovis]|uniref:Alpha-N-acetylglucosaminidase n=1 Tax=Babesia ovis TaxID=5869 RepID=A0A9W5TDE8_BABOV|nr:alpha-N-acetylglucosaminidase [Babesia ovis]
MHSGSLSNRLASPPLFRRSSPRFFSADATDVWSFSYTNRTITLEFRGVSPLPKKRSNNCTHVSNRRLVDAAVSAVRSCDVVALGVASPELNLISRYLDFENQESSNKGKQKQKFKNAHQLIAGYKQFIDVAKAASETGINVISIGRSKQVEAASFGNAATRNKLEVLRLFSLYLRIGDVLKDAGAQEAFHTACPAIYQAVIEEGVFYSFCRLHEALCRIEDDPNCRRKNLKILVIVDQSLVQDLSKLVRERLPILLQENALPMADVMESIDSRSRKGWQRFILQFIILPATAVGSVIFYNLYIYFSQRIKRVRNYFSGQNHMDTPRKTNDNQATTPHVSRE